MPALQLVGTQVMPAAKRRKVLGGRRVLGDRTNANTATAPTKRKKLKQTATKQTAKQQTAPKPPSPALPAGWVVDVSRESGETYYRNTVTDDAQWEVPAAPAVDTTEAVEHVLKTLDELGAAGIRVIECVPPQPQPPRPFICARPPRTDLFDARRSVNALKFGKSLGAGAFGTVRQATAAMDGVKVQVAVKTLAFTERDDFEEKLEEFKQEATVGWAVSSRSRSGVRSLAL